MKLLLFSDLHTNLLSNIQQVFDTHPDYDVCFCLGDIDTHHLALIKECADKDNKPVYGVLGNHDYKNQLDETGIQDIHGERITIIDANSTKLSFVGFSGSYRYKYNPELMMYTQEESIAIANELPDANLIISHDAPYMLYGSEGAHMGFKGISNYLDSHSECYGVIHGHYHTIDNQKLKRGWIKYQSIIGTYRCEIIEINARGRVINRESLF